MWTPGETITVICVGAPVIAGAVAGAVVPIIFALRGKRDDAIQAMQSQVASQQQQIALALLHTPSPTYQPTGLTGTNPLPPAVAIPQKYAGAQQP